jgi:hypothetical protein
MVILFFKKRYVLPFLQTWNCRDFHTDKYENQVGLHPFPLNFPPKKDVQQRVFDNTNQILAVGPPTHYNYFPFSVGDPATKLIINVILYIVQKRHAKTFSTELIHIYI